MGASESADACPPRREALASIRRREPNFSRLQTGISSEVTRPPLSSALRSITRWNASRKRRSDIQKLGIVVGGSLVEVPIRPDLPDRQPRRRDHRGRASQSTAGLLAHEVTVAQLSAAADFDPLAGILGCAFGGGPKPLSWERWTDQTMALGTSRFSFLLLIVTLIGLSKCGSPSEPRFEMLREGSWNGANVAVAVNGTSVKFFTGGCHVAEMPRPMLDSSRRFEVTGTFDQVFGAPRPAGSPLPPATFIGYVRGDDLSITAQWTNGRLVGL